MSEFEEIGREEIPVQFVRAEDGIPGIRQAWDALEAIVDLRSRHFYGAFYPGENEYRACVEVRDGDELVDGLESGALPGGRYLRARLQGDPPGVYERIGPTFDDVAKERAPDESRPGLEYYRRHDEIELFLPV